VLKAKCQAVWRAIAAKFARLRVLVILLIAAIFLSGCVDYDLSIHMADQNHGEIVQHIRLAEQFANFNESVAQDWLKRIERRTRELGGRTKRLSTYDLVTTIPFYNGAELVSKFNQFFQPPHQSTASSTTLASLDWPELIPQLHIIQDNYLLVERNRLTVDLDLRSLGLRSSGGNVLLSPAALLNLDIRLATPWGAESIGAIAPELQDDDKHLMWTLQPGNVNHIEAVFWVPSPLGIGALAIALLVALGMFLKSVLSSKPTSR
jgi:hypothetical protein